MNKDTIQITLESQEDLDSIEALALSVFGPGMNSRTAFRLREGVPHEEALSFVAKDANVLVGSVRQTKVLIGGENAIILGPIVVADAYRNNGVGADLMNEAIAAAKAHGHELIILIGDYPYYKKHGFERVPMGQINFPGPVDRGRILVLPLKEGVKDKFKGDIVKFSDGA